MMRIENSLLSDFPNFNRKENIKNDTAVLKHVKTHFNKAIDVFLKGKNRKVNITLKYKPSHSESVNTLTNTHPLDKLDYDLLLSPFYQKFSNQTPIHVVYKNGSHNRLIQNDEDLFSLLSKIVNPRLLETNITLDIVDDNLPHLIHKKRDSSPVSSQKYNYFDDDSHHIEFVNRMERVQKAKLEASASFHVKNPQVFMLHDQNRIFPQNVTSQVRYYEPIDGFLSAHSLLLHRVLPEDVDNLIVFTSYGLSFPYTYGHGQFVGTIDENPTSLLPFFDGTQMFSGLLVAKVISEDEEFDWKKETGDLRSFLSDDNHVSVSSNHSEEAPIFQIHPNIPKPHKIMENILNELTFLESNIDSFELKTICEDIKNRLNNLVLSTSELEYLEKSVKKCEEVINELLKEIRKLKLDEMRYFEWTSLFNGEDAIKFYQDLIKHLENLESVHKIQIQNKFGANIYTHVTDHIDNLSIIKTQKKHIHSEIQKLKYDISVLGQCLPDNNDIDETILMVPHTLMKGAVNVEYAMNGTINRLGDKEIKFEVVHHIEMVQDPNFNMFMPLSKMGSYEKLKVEED